MTDHSPLVERHRCRAEDYETTLSEHNMYSPGNPTDIRDELNFHIETADAIEALQARVDELERVLKHISCPTQTEKLLWWQEAARAALAREPEKGETDG